MKTDKVSTKHAFEELYTLRQKKQYLIRRKRSVQKESYLQLPSNIGLCSTAL
jgi:hypothetical protein